MAQAFLLALTLEGPVLCATLWMLGALSGDADSLALPLAQDDVHQPVFRSLPPRIPLAYNQEANHL